MRGSHPSGAGAPRSSDRRGDGDRGTRTAPRLLIKDPCNAERLLEATFESVGAAVQLQLFHDGGRSSLDRFRVTGSVQLVFTIWSRHQRIPLGQKRSNNLGMLGN